MEQDQRTCPGCGALTPKQSPCPYCSWTPDLSEESNLDALDSIGSPSAADLQDDSSEPSEKIDEMLLDAVREDLPGSEIQSEDMLEGEKQIEDDSLLEAGDLIETGSVQFRELLKPGSDPEHLLDQVPEEMRGVLAARLKAAEETDSPSFSETTASTLRKQGYIVSEDVHGARLAATPGKSADLSAFDVVRMAADLDGGVQPQAKLLVCSKCQAASPVGETQCQWCGESFPDKQ